MINSKRLIGGLNYNTLMKINKTFNDVIYLCIFRIRSFKIIENFKQPDWCFFEIPDILYDEISYFSNPIDSINIINENIFVDLGLNKEEQYNLTNTILDFVLDSASIETYISFFLIKSGLIFISFLEGNKIFSKLISTYLGNIVSINDNFFGAINSSVFSGGSFCYIAKNIQSNFNVSTYFRTYSEDFAQFERTLLVAAKNSLITYTEGCSAPLFLESQLHVALVEILVKENAKVNYSTVQNWYRGNKFGEGGLYNFTTKRGWCLNKAQLNWVQVETGSSITWKYPSTYLIGDFSFSSFLSLSLISDLQISDTGNKMIHIGQQTKSYVLSKSISLNKSKYVYRGMIKILRNAKYSYSKIQCDSLILGNNTCAVTIPYALCLNSSSLINQEASISKIELNSLFLLLHRGIRLNLAIDLLVYGYCHTICSKLPVDLEVEIPTLISNRTKNNIL